MKLVNTKLRLLPPAVLSVVAGEGVMAIGLMVLISWAFGLGSFWTFAPTLPAMVPNTAFALMCLGLALVLTQLPVPRQTVLVHTLSLLVMILGILTLWQYATGQELGIDYLLFPYATQSAAATFPGRISVHTAVALVLISMAILVLPLSLAWVTQTVHLLTVSVAMLALLALLGTIYDVAIFYQTAPATGMSIPTALSLLVLCVGVVAACPDSALVRLLTQQSIAGVFARRLLLPVLSIPFVFGVLTTLGTRAGWYSLGISSALLVLCTIIALTLLVWHNARTLQGIDALQQQREAERTTLLAAEQRARMNAEESIRARDVLLAVISHDLKNPLTVIKGHAGRLQRIPDAPLDPERISNSAHQIDFAASQMLEQINELLDLAHIQAGQPLMLMRVHVDLVELTTEVVGLYQQTQDLNKLHIEAAAPALTGYWDAVRIRRVISNLVSNALKYSPGNRPVILRLEQHDAMGMWATLEIRDEGIGIPAADLPYVFQPFHRAANVARHIPGSGLGLASARWIVEQHGGTLSVTSEVGVGTNFILRLPMDKVKLG